MRIVTINELQSRINLGKVIERDSRGPKVVKLSNETFLKIFRPRRHYFIARLNPAAKRFALNAKRLQHYNIKTPQILDTFWIDSPYAISACIYQPLVGTSLDYLFKTNHEECLKLLPNLGLYIAQLHKHGIYFRSLHLGNILQTPDQDFGLIDFLDIRFKRSALKKPQIERNFNHLRRYLKRSGLTDFPLNDLLSAYDRARLTLK